MAKDTFYFSHDYNARNDIKIKKLISKYKYRGYGIFWAIIEDLYNNDNALPTDFECIAFDMREDKKIIESIVKDFDLFVFEGDTFGSMSVQKRLDERNSKIIKGRESANKRWHNANPMGTHCQPNAIKERKGKDIKEIERDTPNSIKINGKVVFAEHGNIDESIFTIEHCLMCALNDPRWVESNKATEYKLKEFNQFLEGQSIYTKNLIDYKKHYHNWQKKQKTEPNQKIAKQPWEFI